MLIIMCPGQGAQRPGFLAPWLQTPGAGEHLERLGKMVELDLIHYGTRAPAEAIKDTAVAQPLIVAAGLTAFALLCPGGRLPHGTVTVGHSVGEITAAVISGVLTEAEAMRFVAARSRAMAQAARHTETGMSAILGGDGQHIREAIHAAGMTAANINGPGQIVAAGTKEQLAALAAEPPAGTRVIPLDVAGAFHSPHMSSAIEPLQALAAQLKPNTPHCTLLSNRDGLAVTTGAQALEQLVTQVCAPVRWDLCQSAAYEHGGRCAIELPPAGVLTGLLNRALPRIHTVALKSPNDIETGMHLITDETERHAHARSR